MTRMTMVQALRSAMDVMLERDPDVVVYGQDVGYFGGVFRCTDGLQAKFSAPYCAAAAWVDGTVGLASFSDAAATRAALRPQMDRVRVSERPGPHEPLESAPVRVTVTTAGWSESILVDWAPGSLQDPFTNEELIAKWMDCETNGAAEIPAGTATAWLEADQAQPVTTLLRSLRAAIFLRSKSAAE